MSCSCDFWFKHFYYDKRIRLMNETMEATHKVLIERGPILGPVLAALLNKQAYLKDIEYQKKIISGPVCGAQVVKNGYTTELIL